MRLLALVGKELRTFLRDRALVVVVAFMFLWDPYQSASQFTFAINHYPIAAYDLDRSPESRAFLEELRTPYFSLRRYVTNDREIAPLLVHDAASAVVVIPEGFGRRILQGRAAPVQVISDGTYTPTSQLAGAYIAQIAHDFAETQAGGASRHTALPIVDARLRVRYNASLVEEWYRSLDELFMAVVIIALLLPAAFMVREKEQGTIEQLLVSPVRPWEIMASKLVPMVVVALAATAAGLGILAAAFQLPVRGSLVLFLVATALAVFATGGYGLVIATVARTLPTALLLAFMLHIPIHLLSGNITPVEAMPAWQYYATLLSPQRYYLNIGYSILLKGTGLAMLWPDFLGLLLVGTGTFAVGAWRFLRQFG